MANVGFCGGCSVRDLGSASDMKVFFNCIELAAARLPPNIDSKLLTDRLYRRYLRLEELAPAAALIVQVRDILADIPTDSINWKAMGWDPSATRLDLSPAKVSDVFRRHIKGALDLIENAESFNKRFDIYRPAITIASDLPRFVRDENRPLTDYDRLEGDPMWLR